MKMKIIASSVAVIALCLCLVIGSTFALFTETTKVNIAVTAGDLGVTAEIVESSMMMRSLEDPAGAFTRDAFSNGGDASVVNSVLEIEKMTPGDAIRFDVKVKNTGNIAARYNVKWASTGVAAGETDLYDALTITVVDANGNAFEGTNAYSVLGAAGSETTFTVTVTFPNGTADHDNPYQGALANIAFTVEAVQYNGVDQNGNLIEN